jgi:hypothetical protein
MIDEPIVLMDAPEDGYCESHGWISVDASEDEARDLLAPWCIDEDSEPGMRPAGPAKRVWLKPDGPLDLAERWHKCEPTDEGAREFYEFDATDTVRVPAS